MSRQLPPYVLFISFVVSGCIGDKLIVTEVDSADGASSVPVDDTPQKKYDQTINFGITLQRNEARTRYSHKPYIDYLAEKARVNIRLVVAQEYEQLERDVADGIVHLADFPPLAFARAYQRLKGKLVYLATYKYTSKYDKKARDFYRGYIIASAKSKTKRLKDLKKRKFAFVERTSSSGYNYPLALLLKKGIDPDRYFSKVFFAGSHEAVVMAVVRGSAAAGATYDVGYHNYMKKNPKSLRIIKKTAPIPNAALCASSKLSRSIRKRILQAALAVRPSTKTSDGRRVVALKRGFTSVGLTKKSPKYYNFVRETDKLLASYAKRKRKRK